MDETPLMLGEYVHGLSGPLLGASWTSLIEFGIYKNSESRPAIILSSYAESGKDSSASALMTNIGCVSVGRMAMPTKLKSQTTTKRAGRSTAQRSQPSLGERRLPQKRPPTHPGEMLLEEFLKPLGVSQSEFAIRLGVSFPRLNEITRRKRAVTPNTALRLARVLGMPADFWLGLQQDWDLWHAMRSEQAEEIAHLEPLQSSG